MKVRRELIFRGLCVCSSRMNGTNDGRPMVKVHSKRSIQVEDERCVKCCYQYRGPAQGECRRRSQLIPDVCIIWVIE